MAREVPRARPTHRDAGEVNAAAIAVKFADRTLERRHGLQFHVAVPLVTGPALRKNDDGFVSIAETPECRTEPDRHLAKVVVSPFAAAVQEENHRPVMQLRVMRRQPDAISILVVG